VKRRMGSATVLLLAALGGAATACGRYGPPVRAEEYQKADEERARAEAERQKQTTPQERNDPIPAAP
jgi:hypothetical protein